MTTILEEADKLTSQDRRQSYGHPADDFAAIAQIWNAMLTKAGLLKEGKYLNAPMVQALMIGLKLSRLSNDLHHRDSLVDICGYARIVEMTHEENTRRWASDK